MTLCPYCGYKATQHEELEDRGFNPKLGDISFCINCGEVSEFTRKGLIKLDVSKLPKEEQEQIKEIETSWLKTRSLTKKLRTKK